MKPWKQTNERLNQPAKPDGADETAFLSASKNAWRSAKRSLSEALGQVLRTTTSNSSRGSKYMAWPKIPRA